jgi:hypothetical protein
MRQPAQRKRVVRVKHEDLFQGHALLCPCFGDSRQHEPDRRLVWALNTEGAKHYARSGGVALVLKTPGSTDQGSHLFWRLAGLGRR